MLRGAHTLNLDPKGRLAIPRRFRESLGQRCDGRMVVTVNNTNERCLWMYPLDEWQRVEEKIVALSSFEASHQTLKRFLLGHATDVDMDKSGRVLLPPPLREFAMMTKAVCLIGQGNKFELWDEQIWNRKRTEWLDEKIDIGKISVELEQLAL